MSDDDGNKGGITDEEDVGDKGQHEEQFRLPLQAHSNVKENEGPSPNMLNANPS